MKTKYFDCHGEQISYGDILKFPDFEKMEKTEHSPKTPFGMIVKYDDNTDMLYISGMDEFTEIEDSQYKEDIGTTKIRSVEIFANRDVYEGNLHIFEGKDV